MSLVYAVICRVCGTSYPPEVADVFFRRTRTRVSRIRATRRPVCVACEQTSRDERKRRRRGLTKAVDAIKTHAKSYGMGKDDFAAKYGWDAPRMARDVEHAYGGVCGYCSNPYAEMGHGLADVTFDIIDPEREPYYATNVKLCCRTCNTEKGKLRPEQWANKLLGWVLWRRNRERRANGELPTQPHLWEVPDG